MFFRNVSQSLDFVNSIEVGLCLINCFNTGLIPFKSTLKVIGSNEMKELPNLYLM